MLGRAPSALAALATLVVLLTACDSEDPPTPPAPSSTSASSASPDVVRAGVAALYAGDDADTAADAQRDEADCFADALLDRLDVDALTAAGIVQDDGTVVAVLPVLDVPTAQAWVAAQGACADFVEVSTRAVVTQSKGKADPEAYASCLRAAISDEQVDAALVATLTGGFDSAEVAALGRAQADCSRSAQPSD